ncbi:hypothetical protein MP228_003843 [Amoeboaphelidium protococcarum]|nr:hypothetical protein MP228_003843 [Amoeboaphelidium protococcarum]
MSNLPAIQNLSLQAQQQIKAVEPIFKISKVQFEWKGKCVDLCVMNDTLIMALDTDSLLRIDLQNPARVEEIQLYANVPKQSMSGRRGIYKIFLDYSGHHLLISTLNGDVFYLYYTWKRAKLLQKVRGFQIECVAWCRDSVPFSRRMGAGRQSTGPLLVSTRDGYIYELELDPAEDAFLKREERYCKLIYRMNLDQDQRVIGIYYDQLSDKSGGTARESDRSNQHYVIIATQNRLFQFRGSASPIDSTQPSLESIFLRYPNDRDMNYQELPGSLDTSELKLLFHHQQNRLNSGMYDGGSSNLLSNANIGHLRSLAWTIAPGVYTATIEDQPDGIVHNIQLYPYPSQVDSKTGEFHTPAPMSMACTAFHLILLYDGVLKVINRMNDEVVYEQAVNFLSQSRICVDLVKNTFWISDAGALYELVITDEDRDVWQLYLKRNQFSAALEHAKTTVQTDKVRRSQAQYYYQQKRFVLAAKTFAQTSIPIEEVALMFMEHHESLVNNGDNSSDYANIDSLTDQELESLIVYLESKALTLSAEDQVQKALINTWLLELKLNEIHLLRQQLQFSHRSNNVQKQKEDRDSNLKHKLEQAQSNFKRWISNAQVAESLDYQSSIAMIREYGCEDEMIYLAEFNKDHSLLLEYYSERQMVDELFVILDQHKDSEQTYQYSPSLIVQKPYEIVGLWIRCPGLDPQKLLPAMAVYNAQFAADNVSVPSHKEHQVVRYLEYCINRLAATENELCNLLLSSYVQCNAPDEVILSFIQQIHNFLDLQNALKVCLQNDRQYVLIVLYGCMKMYDSAVDQALQLQDVDLAKKFAQEPEEDLQKRRLLLKIYQYIIDECKDIPRAFKMLENDQLVGIEQLLALLPEDVPINDFKEHFYNAVEMHKYRIDESKKVMTVASQDAQRIRQRLDELQSRVIKVSPRSKCQLCSVPLFSRSYYAFSCEHFFHQDCLIAQMLDDVLSPKLQKHVIQLQRKAQEFRDQQMMHQRSSVIDPLAQSAGYQLNPHQQELDDLVAADCIACGDIAAKSIDKPLIKTRDLEELNEWQIN